MSVGVRVGKNLLPFLEFLSSIGNLNKYFFLVSLWVLNVVFKRTFCSAEQFGHFQAELFCSAEPNIYLKSSALAEHPKILYF